MNNIIQNDKEDNKEENIYKDKRIWVLNDVGQFDYQKYWNYPIIEKLNSSDYFKYMNIIGSLGVKILQCKPFLLKMLSVRGYIVSKIHDNLITDWIIKNYNNYNNISDAFEFKKNKFAIDMDLDVINDDDNDNNNNKNNKIQTKKEIQKLYLIFYLQSDVFGVDIARNLINYMNKNTITNCLLISKHVPTPQVLKEIKCYSCLNIEIWQIEDFLYDWTQIGWVPLHHVMSKNQTNYFLQLNNYNMEDLPKLQSLDIMARYHGLKKNQLVCIQRTEPMIHAYFRIVE